MLTAQRINELTQAYADGSKRLETAVASVPRDALDYKPGPEHWSIRENLAHLADTDLVAAARLRYILAHPGATLVAFDQNKWATALSYSTRSVGGSLALFRAVRESTAEMLRRAPAEAWEYAGTHTELGQQTVEWIVNHFVEHLTGHLATIAKRRDQFAAARR
jgi:hypothetical protein